MRAGALIIMCTTLLACPGPSEMDAGTGGGGATGGGTAGGGTAGGGGSGGGSAGGSATGGGFVPLVCTDVDAGPPPDAGAPRTAPPYDGGYGTFCVEYANAYCDYEERCGLAVTGTRSDCVAFFQKFTCGVTVDEVDRGQVRFDRAAAGLCLSSLLPDAGCAEGCNSYLSPASGNGGACLSPHGCESSQACAGPACGKTCQDAGAVGGPCYYGQCAPGAWCDSAADRCRAPGGADAGCTGSDPFNPQCDPATYCNADAGRCTPLPAAGEPCFGLRCGPGAYCDTAANPDLCRAYAAAGQACSSDTQCGPTSFCASTATCSPRKPAGVACTLTSQCETGLLCFLNTCTVRKAEGQPCRGAECVSGTQCDDVTHRCEATKILGHGEQCTDDTRICSIGLVCTGAQINRDGGLGCFGTCVPQAVGDRCFTQSRCPTGAFCSDAGVCAAASGTNPCQSSAQCTPDRYCTTARSCAPRHDAGEPCDRGDSCLPPNGCYGSLADGGATCRPNLPGPGEVCNSVFECQFPLNCMNGICVSAGHPGEPCIFGGYCFGVACQLDGGPMGLCAGALRDAGSACLDATDCASGYCDVAVCRDRCP